MTSPIPKVDVHHHIIPLSLLVISPLKSIWIYKFNKIEGISYGLKGMKVPEWTVSGDKTFSESINVHTSIFSVSTPGVSYISDPEESAAVARSMNEYCASLRDKNPHAYGFFATVPSLQHTDLVLREIRYAFDTLHADGVTLFTSYETKTGDGYLGHLDYLPVWEELNARQAVVFVHPINNRNNNLFNDKLPMPAFDWPHETGRTAIDLIIHRRLQQFPNVKIILSHAGGTLISLIARSTMIALPEFGGVMSAEDIVDQGKKFYFDLALSGSKEVLPLVLGFAEKGHVLFGSDYPHATVGFSKKFTDFIDAYEMSDEMRKEVYHGAAEKLFPRLSGTYEI
ncbi:6-methylsalicylic acid decarboxylase [Lachnellula occidentalis]|uniref:6-methylsalicylate decarboxylase n=1 Tax=Lachnellula occidentalis TaxID=215460 RepID=A0A8H8RS15_9HELO|nr:6-methylsalicylic acid decarboxylase [Lachnellula occidentalis]